MSSISAALSDSSATNTEIWVEIPTGYVPLPTEDIARNMAVATDVIDEQASPEQLPAAHAMIGLLRAYLESLAARNGLYCGVGHHVSAVDGSELSSSLVVALQEYPEQVNPRILLKDLLNTKLAAGDQGEADLVDLAGRPALFFESTRVLPTPRIPGLTGETSTVYQLEALVPSADGSKLVSIEFSTPFMAHGAEFRAMVVGMAASVAFEAPGSGVASVLGG
ncbi:MAG TPA: hypothetical protein VJ914_15645 [Pseudonocardiaceae bacterium]|nr:hypothetical protein [Pseudonocardiaceae bacterium]